MFQNFSWLSILYNTTVTTGYKQSQKNKTRSHKCEGFLTFESCQASQFWVEGCFSVPACSLSPAQLEVQAPDDGLIASVLDLKAQTKKVFLLVALHSLMLWTHLETAGYKKSCI